jgi:hypothetical protein
LSNAAVTGPEEAIGLLPPAATAVAAFGLDGATTVAPRPPFDAPAWRAMGAAFDRDRLWGFVAAAVTSGALECSADQRDEVFARAAATARDVLRVEARLLATVATLTAAGIDHRFLKGPTTAIRAYPQPGLRSFVDVDVVVPSGAFDAARDLLERDGGTRHFPEVRPGFDRRFSKGTSLTMKGGVSVDLHRTFVLGPYGFVVDLEGIFARADTVVVAGRPVNCLEIHDATVHACLHAVLGDWPPRLTPLRDVAELLASDQVDPDEVLRRGSEWRSLAVVARGVQLAREAFGLDSTFPLARWAAGYRPQRWERRALSVYGEGHTYRRQALAAMPFVPGRLAKLAYARDLALLSLRYLSQREGSYLRRNVRAVTMPSRPRPSDRGGRGDADSAE